MPRLPRPQIADGIYHVTTRGVRKLPIFEDDDDRESFLTILGVVISRFRWTLLQYCEMTSHYHLLFQTPQPNIAAGMQLLNQSYAVTFNSRRAFTGHLFERRYGAEFVQTQEHLLETVRYIANNPVEAGICSDPADWPWSSFASSLGLRPAREFLDTDALLVLMGLSSPDELEAVVREREPIRRLVAV